MLKRIKRTVSKIARRSEHRTTSQPYQTTDADISNFVEAWVRIRETEAKISAKIAEGSSALPIEDDDTDLINFLKAFIHVNPEYHERLSNEEQWLREVLPVWKNNRLLQAQDKIYQENAPKAIEAQCSSAQVWSEFRQMDRTNMSQMQSAGMFSMVNTLMIREFLKAAMDSTTISAISNFAWRMGLCEKSPHHQAHFQMGLSSEQVVQLMNAGIPAVCISYKHTRRPRESDGAIIGYEDDVKRVTKAVERVMQQLHIDQLLFWCDIIGRSPRDKPWAAQGVDPYLWMPTLRIVSMDFSLDIANSFWMCIEVLAATYRGGMFTYAEDWGYLINMSADPLASLFSPTHGSETTMIPKLHLDFDVCKTDLARQVCGPQMFHRKARVERDKIEVMRYTMIGSHESNPEVFPLTTNEDGLTIKLETIQDCSIFMMNVAAREDNRHVWTLYVPKPTDESGMTVTIAGTNRKWKGLEEFYPHLQLLKDKHRKLFSHNLGQRMESRVVNTDSDGVTTIISRPWGSKESSTLKIRLRDFKEHSNRLSGNVINFVPCSIEEEDCMKNDGNIHKPLDFKSAR